MDVVVSGYLQLLREACRERELVGVGHAVLRSGEGHGEGRRVCCRVTGPLDALTQGGFRGRADRI